MLLDGTVSVSAHNAHTLSHDEKGSPAALYFLTGGEKCAAAVPECAAWID